MNLDQILEEDLTEAAKKLYNPAFNGKTFFVTGATGLIGSQFCKALMKCNDLYDADITVVAYIRNRTKAATVFQGYDNEKLGFVKTAVHIDSWRNQVGELQSAVDYELVPENFINFAL